MSKLATSSLIAAALAFSAGNASAALSIYEPFDYATTTPQDDNIYLGDGSQAGGLGLGTWRQVPSSLNGDGSPNNEIDVVTGLTFTDSGSNVFPVLGNAADRIDRVGTAVASSDIDNAATLALTADGSSMWMTFLFRDRGFSGPNSTVSIASEDGVPGDPLNLAAAGFGIGAGVIPGGGGANRKISLSIYDNSASDTVVQEAGVTFNGPGASGVHLFAVKVNWNASGTDDEIFMWDITDITTEPDEGSALISTTVDWTQAEQNSLDVLNLSITQVDAFDEIRIGTTAASVGLVPEPSSLALLGLGGLLIARRRRG